MLIHVAQEMTTWLGDINSWSDVCQSWQLFEPNLLAQQFDQNVFARFGAAFDNFMKSGQVWALLIGLVIGYLLRGFTTYG